MSSITETGEFQIFFLFINADQFEDRPPSATKKISEKNIQIFLNDNTSINEAVNESDESNNVFVDFTTSTEKSSSSSNLLKSESPVIAEQKVHENDQLLSHSTSDPSHRVLSKHVTSFENSSFSFHFSRSESSMAASNETQGDKSPSHASQEGTTKQRKKKLKLKNLTKKNRETLKIFVRNDVIEKIRKTIASNRKKESIMLKFENEIFETEYIIRFLHSYTRFVIYSNAESVNLNFMPEKPLKSKTNTDIMKI